MRFQGGAIGTITYPHSLGLSGKLSKRVAEQQRDCMNGLKKYHMTLSVCRPLAT